MRYLSLLLFLLPFFANAAVTINEVAWMGNSASANDEWIELYNNGSDTDVDGWQLSDGMNLNISLSGTIPANSYAVLERTDDSSAPGTAFLIYTGALTNTGATLSLRRGDGGIEDQVAGGDGWQNIGGDNVTKETAQYTSNGWITSTPTPGMVNKSTDNKNTSSNTDDSSSSYTSTQTSNSEDTIVSGPLDKDFKLKIKSPSVAYVNQTISISAEPDGVPKHLLNYIKYFWNLGDSSWDTHRYIKHTYSYPGEYVIVLSAKYKSNEQVARKNIKILPVDFSITRTAEGDIQINNDAKYEINLSDYKVVGNKSFKLPENTILLPNGTITISKDKVEASSVSLVRLFDKEQVLVASTNSQKEYETDGSRSNFVDKSVPESFSFTNESVVQSEAKPVVAAASTTNIEKSTDIQTKETDSNGTGKYWTYALLMSVMVVGVTGLLFAPNK